METEINLHYITSGSDGPKHLLYKLSRSQFEQMVGDYITKSIDLVKQTLKEAGLEANQINEIVLVGDKPECQKSLLK